MLFWRCLIWSLCPIPEAQNFLNPYSLNSPPRFHQGSLPQWAHVQALLTAPPFPQAPLISLVSSEARAWIYVPPAHTRTAMDELAWRRNTGEVFGGRGGLLCPCATAFGHFGQSKLGRILLWPRDSWERMKVSIMWSVGHVCKSFIHPQLFTEQSWLLSDAMNAHASDSGSQWLLQYLVITNNYFFISGLLGMQAWVVTVNMSEVWEWCVSA